MLERRTATDAEALRCLGSLGALVLGELLKDNMVVGIAWGTASQAVVRALSPTVADRRPSRPTGRQRGNELTGRSTRPSKCAGQPAVLQAQHFYINAPLVVSSAEVAAALRADHSIAEVLELAGRSDIALLGIGTTEPETCTTHQAGYVSRLSWTICAPQGRWARSASTTSTCTGAARRCTGSRTVPSA